MEENIVAEKQSILTKIFLGKYSILTSFIIIFLINLFLFICYNGNATLFVDTSRELYVPMAMNDGGVLYKDIFNVYAPLGYQLNAIFIKLFGENISTFFNIGFINSTFILWGLFLLIRFIVKSSSLYKIAMVSFIAASCLYCTSSTNYIFPYSYSLVYALNTFIWALVSVLYFMKSKGGGNKYLYTASLLYGASIACKYEFSAFIFVLLGICIYKKVPLKTIIISMFFIFLVPAVSLADLFIKGVTFEDLRVAIINIILLSKAKSVGTLYKYLGFIPNLTTLKFVGIYFIKVLGFVISIICYYTLICYLVLFLNSLNKYKMIYYSLMFIIGLIPLFLALKFLIPTFVESNAFYFSWIGIFTLVLFLLKWKKILNKNKYLFILFVSTILCSAKCIFNISFNSYGTYFFPLLFICNILYFTEIAVSLDEKDKKVYRGLFIIILTVFFLLFSISNSERINLIFENTKYNFYKGYLYPEKLYSNSVYSAIRYIKENTKPDDTVLVLPEGAMINFFTDRKSHNKFYYLIPPNIEIFGEENIVKELEEDLPNYLVIQPMSFTNFNETYFCESFGNKICALIPKYYEHPIVLGKDFWIAIYKKKEI